MAGHCTGTVSRHSERRVDPELALKPRRTPSLFQPRKLLRDLNEPKIGSMEKSELLGLAREYAKSVDLYELLGTDALKAKEPREVQRAYRKQSIKYHPDKLG